MACTMALAGDALAQVMLAGLSAEDLLHASRVCRAWRDAVFGSDADPVWRALCAQHAYCFVATGGPARLQFKAAHHQVLKDRRLRRRINAMAARSAVAALERDVARLREALREEATANRRRRGEAASAARLAQAQVSMQGWQLGVVRAHHQRLVQPQPIQGEWHVRNLEQAIKESDMQLRVLSRELRSKEAQLAAQRRRVSAMTGA